MEALVIAALLQQRGNPPNGLDSRWQVGPRGLGRGGPLRGADKTEVVSGDLLLLVAHPSARIVINDGTCFGGMLPVDAFADKIAHACAPVPRLRNHNRARERVQAGMSAYAVHAN